MKDLNTTLWYQIRNKVNRLRNCLCNVCKECTATISETRVEGGGKHNEVWYCDGEERMEVI
jgi:hypothetical protein